MTGRGTGSYRNWKLNSRTDEIHDFIVNTEEVNGNECVGWNSKIKSYLQPYLLLNESVSDILLKSLIHCIDLLIQEDFFENHDFILNEIAQLQSVIKKILVEVAQEEEVDSVKKFDVMIKCFNCEAQLLRSNWCDHIADNCRSNFQNDRKCLFKISRRGIDCCLCGITCESLFAKNDHEETLRHKSELENVIDFNCSAMYCSVCRCNLPNNVIHCYHHLLSVRHVLLERCDLEWRRGGVGYLGFGETAVCLICNEDMAKEDLHSHHLIHHADGGQKFGLCQVPSPVQVWCSRCSLRLNVDSFASHNNLQCSQSIIDYFCQNCLATISSHEVFLSHVKNCRVNKEEIIRCFHCGLLISTIDLAKHLSFECKFDLIPEGKALQSVYKCFNKMLKCMVCDVDCFSAFEIETHNTLPEHSHNAKNVLNLIDTESVYCINCRERIPNKPHLIFYHLNNVKHLVLVQDIAITNVRYLTSTSHIKCLLCLKDLQKCDLDDHDNLNHMSGDEKVVWCSSCNLVVSKAEIIQSHTPLNCNKSLVETYCQWCDSNFRGSFTDHFDACPGRPIFSLNDQPFDDRTTRLHVVKCDVCRNALTNLQRITDRFAVVCSDKLVNCFYCQSACPESELCRHIKFQCTSIFSPSGEFSPIYRKISDKSVFVLSVDKTECNFCGIGCEILEMDGHLASSHDEIVASKLNEVGWFTIYCTICQENIPYSQSLCIDHTNSQKHLRLKNKRSDWLTEDVRYLSVANGIRCLTCQDKFLAKDVGTHHNATHPSGATLVGTVKCADKVWCSFCDSICIFSCIESHIKECKKSIQNFYCQMCKGMVVGRDNFYEHLFNCSDPAFTVCTGTVKR